MKPSPTNQLIISSKYITDRALDFFTSSGILPLSSEYIVIDVLAKYLFLDKATLSPAKLTSLPENCQNRQSPYEEISRDFQ